MKKLSLFLIFVSLTSCYSYRQSAFLEGKQNVDSSKVYKIQIGENLIKVKNLNIEGENFVYNQNGKTKTIPSKEVTLVKERKFSLPKTLGLVAGGSTLAMGIVAIVALQNLHIDFDWK